MVHDSAILSYLMYHRALLWNTTQQYWAISCTIEPFYGTRLSSFELSHVSESASMIHDSAVLGYLMYQRALLWYMTQQYWAISCTIGHFYGTRLSNFRLSPPLHEKGFKEVQVLKSYCINNFSAVFWKTGFISVNEKGKHRNSYSKPN